jgi:phosphoribosylformylglycinamidine (FGAM) synthase-like enzyme
MWQFAESVAGIGEACRAFEIPITGGNVSLYNETEGRAILPTPVLGVVGLIEDQSAVLGRVFPAAESTIVLLGESRGELGGSEYLQTVHGLLRGVPPAIDLKQERALQGLLPALASEKLIQSAHDVSEGGFAVALAECCFDTGGRGADVDLPPARSELVPADIATLFGESVPQVIVATTADRAETVVERAKAAGLPARIIGKTGGASIIIRVGGKPALTLSVAEAEHVWATSIEERVTSRDTAVVA